MHKSMSYKTVNKLLKKLQQSCPRNTAFAASTAPRTHLDVCSRVDLMNAIAWCSARLPVQIETLDKHRVVAKATHPDVTLPPTLQLNPPADVEPAGQQHQQH